MRLGAIFGMIFGAGLFLSAAPSRAQAPGGFDRPAFDLQLFRPAVDSKGYVTVNASQVLGHLDFSLGLIGTWAGRPLRLQLDAGESYPGTTQGVGTTRVLDIQNLITPQLQFALGLFKHVEVAIGVPLSVMTGERRVCQRDANSGDLVCTGFEGGPNNRDDLSFSKTAFGDLALHIKGRILNTSRHPVGLGALLSVYLPVTRWAGGEGPNYLLSEDNVTLRPQVILDKEWGRARRWRTALNVGTLVRFATATFTDTGKPNVVDSMRPNMPFCYPTDMAGSTGPCGTGLSRSVGTQLTYGIGVSYQVVRQRFDILGEFYGYADITGQEKAYPLEGLGAIKLYLARNSFFMAGAGGGVYGLADSGRQTGGPLWRAFVGFIFEPNIGDRDGDGIKDDVDKCPDNPEDYDDFEDEDGCPEPDNDKDGIPDVDDKCPNEPETKNGFEDEDGCPDTVDLDRDGDGIPDRLDKCPDDPEDKDGFEDEDGCPDPDNDKDGILDVDDLCPNDPEDRDGFEDQDGCPDPDNDKDRILDVDDRCPNEPEVYNGFEDEDGCPDKGRVIVRRGKLEILDKIYFETDKAIIKPISYPILDAIAATMKGNPQILLIEVQGHADERGEDDYNMRLTEDRSQAVKTYLIDKGVEAGRLQAHGYGETRPVCKQHNENCWSKNRRVEFVILKRADEESR